MKKLFVFVLLGGFVLPSASWAIDLKQAKFTQVVNSVDVISQSAQGRHAAAVNDVFTMPDVLRTGPDSRAELVAADNTITRVGANTVFSYDPATRTIDLQQGSILFHSPHGKGGGTIHTGSATASVLGTTIIVTCTPNGGFKLLNLEGQAEIKFLNGLHQTLQPGQMTFALQGGGTSPVIVFRLDSQTKGSTLVNGFATPLPSLGKINAEVTRQLLQILNNNAQDTGLVVGDNATPDSVQVLTGIINQTPPPTSFDSDSSIVGSHHVSTLPVSYSPLNSAQIETPITLPDNIANAVTLQAELALLDIGAPPVGFVGDNIDIDTGLGDLGTPIDLSAYASDDPNHPNFEILAAKDLRIWQSAKFTGMSGANDTIGLIAGGKMLIAQNSTLEADTGNFDLVADSFGVLDTSTGLEKMNPDAPLNPEYPNELLDVSVINNGGGVDIQSVSSLKIESGIYNAGNGDLNVIAGGNIYIDSATLEASSSPSVSQNGSVYIAGTGYVKIYDSSISGHGDVNIESGGTLTLNAAGSDTIEAGGSVYLTSDNAPVNIYDYNIYADFGGVSINAEGSVYLSGNDHIEAGYDTDTAYDLNINSYGSTVDIDDAYLYASGNVIIKSSDTLTLENSTKIESYGSHGISVTSGNADVDVYDSYLYAYNGDINISAGRNIDIENSDINQNGSVYANAGGFVNIYDVYYDKKSSSDTYLTDWNITAGSYVHIGADADVQIHYSDIYAGGDVNITSGGTVSSGNVDVRHSPIYAGDSDYASTGGNVNIKAHNGTVYLSDDDIKAYGGASSAGDVSINGSGDVSIYTSTISADGSVDIETTGGTLNMGIDPPFDVTITAGYDVKLSASADIYIYDTGITAGANYAKVNFSGGTYDYSSDPDILTSGGVVSISAGGEAYIFDSTIDLQGNISIPRAGITSDDGVTISTGGKADLSGNTVYIIGSSIKGDIISISDSTVTANNGGVNIYNHGSASFNAVSSSTISGSTISLNNIDISASIIKANGGDVNIVSDGDQSIQLGSEPDVSSDSRIVVGDISITDSSSIYASGDVNITSGNSVSTPSINSSSDVGKIDIEGSDVYAGYDYNNEQPSLSDGSVKIHAYDGNVYLGNDYIEATTVSESEPRNVNISGQTKTATDGENEVISASGGSIDISALNNVNILNTHFDVGGGIKISGSQISANNGDVDISSSGTLSIISAGGPPNIFGSDVFAGNIGISGSTISANNGSVNIENNGSISFASRFDSAGTIRVDHSTIAANFGDVTIGKIGGVGGVDLESSTITATVTPTITASDTGNITVRAGTGLTVNGSTLNADTVAGTIALNSTAGQTTIQNSSMQAFYINVNSPDGILLDGTGGILKGNTMNLTAGMGDASGGPTTTIQNTDLGNLTIVNVQSHTVNIDNDNLSSKSRYNFTVFNHGYYIDNGHQPGYANFNNDTLDHAPILNGNTAGTLNPANNGGIGLAGSGAVINVY